MISAKDVARAAVVGAMVLLAAGAVQAITIDTVPVSNTGNTGELSGSGAGGYGPDRICGAVDYDFRIGTYEVTAGQYTAFLNAVGGVDTYGLYNTRMWSSDSGCKIERTVTGSGYSYSVASDWANRPVNYVSFWDSCRFANWLSNGQPSGAQGAGTTERGAYTLDGYNGNDGRTIQRNTDWKWAVTSEDEWYKAAYYDPATATYFDYPTSSDTAPGRDMADPSGNNANYYTGASPYPIDSGKYTTVAGEFQNSASPYGTFDQGGNVWEWNDTIISGSLRGIRGGSHFYDVNNVLHASFRDHGYFPPDETYGYLIGFRVSEAIPEPATMAGMVLGIGGLVGYIRRRMAR